MVATLHNAEEGRPDRLLFYHFSPEPYRVSRKRYEPFHLFYGKLKDRFRVP